jgi:hypothetical protein
LFVIEYNAVVFCLSFLLAWSTCLVVLVSFMMAMWIVLWIGFEGVLWLLRIMNMHCIQG